MTQLLATLLPLVAMFAIMYFLLILPEKKRTKKYNTMLSELKVNDEVNINFKPLQKESKPPKRYSVESLNNFLKNPFKEYKEKEVDDTVLNDDSLDVKAMFEGIELGTEATRSGIIKNAITSKYISLKDNVYHLEDNGKYYIDKLREKGFGSIIDKIDKVYRYSGYEESVSLQ